MSSHRIHKLNIQNFLRLEAFSVEPDGNHVVISARNGEGKTSVVEAIFEALQGSSSKDRPEPVHRGAEKALIELDLGEYLVEKHIAKDGKARLIVKTKDGSKVSSPQKLLDGLLSQYCLDPVAFWHRRPQDQLDDVLKVCGIAPPVQQVEMITRVPSPAIPGESADQYLSRLSGDEVGEWYRRRRDQHRVVETNRGAVEKQETLVKTLQETIPADVCVDQHAIMQEIDEAMHITKLRQQWASEWDASDRDLQKANDTMDSIDANISSIKAELEALEKKRIALQANLVEQQQRKERGAAIIRELQTLRLENGKQLDKYPDQQKRIAELQSMLRQSQIHQAVHIKAQQAQERLDALRTEYAESQRSYAKLDLILEELRKLRKAMLEGVDLGVDGLEVGNGELLLNGVSFKQASTAQKLLVALAVAMRGQGALKLIRIDNGEMLDAASRRILLDLATQKGYQVIMTCVSNDKELKVEIVDGD